MELSNVVKLLLDCPDFKSRIALLIDLSGHENGFIANKMGMELLLFSEKKKNGNWDDDDLKKLLDWVENEEFEDYQLGKMMEEIDRSDNLEYVSAEEFKKSMGWEL